MDTKNEILKINEMISENEQNTISLKKKVFELEQEINKKELNKKVFSEKNLYDFAMNVLYKNYNLNKRLDIVENWAKKEVEEFKKSLV
ncbi:MAG: hypothetical protein GY849_02230 [Deltaproteobacteria bacterium]|nr:hypothetical protein [Deltaproteobacteria bacterium]